MTRSITLLGMSSAIAFVSLGAASPAFAQGEVRARSGAGLGEIVVTAQRREESVQEIPLAVTAFSPEQIAAAQIEETTDLVRFTPSVTGGLNTGTGSALTFYIRGLGSTEQIATFDVPVATYVDEIYFARQSVNAVNLFDIERVEVLRGPQGTLFGRNTTGGAVSIVTRKPSTEIGGYVDASTGSFDRRVIRGSVDLPASEQLLTKVSGFFVNDEGYGRSLTTGERLNGEEAWGVRGAVRWLPTERVTWDVALDFVDQSRTTLGTNPVDPEYTSRTGLRQTDCTNSIREVFLTRQLGNCARVESGGLTSNLQYEFDWATLNLITGYRSTDQNFALDFFNGTQVTGGYTIVNEIRNQQLTQEIKLVGETDRWNWVAGLFYLDEDNKTAELDFFTALGGIIGDWTMFNAAESFAVYAQGDYSVTDALTVTLGGRYTTEDKTLAYLNGVLPLTAARPTSANLRAIGVPLSLDESKFTPRIAVTYQLDDDRLIYASATNGFKSGGWNTRVTNVNAVTAFGPEEAWSYEIGARTEWFDNRLRVNATVYYQDVKDLQLLSGANGQFSTRNAGDLEALGVELEVAAAPTDQIDLFATVSAADPDYKNIPAFRGAGNVPCTATPEPLQCTTVRDDPVRYPELQGTLGGAYTAGLGDIGQLIFTGSMSYSQTYWTSTYNDTPFATGVPFGAPAGTPAVTRRLSKTPPTSLFNVGARYVNPDGRFQASLTCSNCGDEYYPTSSLFGLGYYNDPRRVTFGIRLSY